MAKGLSLFEKRRRRNRTALRAKAGTRPRLSVHRSSQHIYAQIIDDAAGRTLAVASTLEKDVRGTAGATSAAAADVGKRLAERRSEERRVRKEGVGRGKSRGGPE